MRNSSDYKDDINSIKSGGKRSGIEEIKNTVNTSSVLKVAMESFYPNGQKMFNVVVEGNHSDGAVIVSISSKIEEVTNTIAKSVIDSDKQPPKQYLESEIAVRGLYFCDRKVLYGTPYYLQINNEPKKLIFNLENEFPKMREENKWGYVNYKVMHDKINNNEVWEVKNKVVHIKATPLTINELQKEGWKKR